MMKKSVFYFPIWGESYINSFSKFALKCLEENLKKSDYNFLNTSKIEIWTFKKDIKKIESLNIIKELKKKILINIESIDLIYNSLNNYNINKYQTLSILQKIFMNTHSYKYDFFWFIYPDFIFSKNLIKNFSKISNTYDAYFLPVPQIIEENINEIFEKNKYFSLSSNITELIFKHLHPIVKICDVKNSKTNTPSLFISSDKNSIAIKSFHIHPIVIKSDISNLDMNSKFYSSLDEGLVETLFDKKLFLTKDNFFAACCSLLGEKEYKLPNEKFDLNKTVSWCSNHVNKTHIKISEYTYFIKKNRRTNSSKILEKNIERRIKPILKKLSDKKTNSFNNFPNPKISLVDQNNELYSLIRDNYFKNYFKKNKNQLKEAIKKNNTFSDPINHWLKKLYIKNL